MNDNAMTVDAWNCVVPHDPVHRPERAGEHEGVSRHFLHRGRGLEFDMEAAWVRARLPRESHRVIDVGCGIGGLLPTIGLDRAWGVDRCADGLGLTRKRWPDVPLICADALHLPVCSGFADAVTAQHVLEHLGTGEEACREWYRVLKPGGRLLLLTPNAAFRDPSVFSDDTHSRLFDADDLAHLVKRIGFTIDDLRTLGVAWFRQTRSIPGGWRLRRLVTRQASTLSAFRFWRWRGQTLCCAARRPTDP